MSRPPDDLPPSAKFIANVLRDRESATRQTLLRETDLPERTLDNAIGHLVEAGLVEKTTDSTDARRTVYEFNRENGSGRHG